MTLFLVVYDESMRRVLAAAVVIVGVAGAGLLNAQTSEAPVFPNLAFLSVDGTQRIDLESLRGRPVLLTFWASWCGPCRMELPELAKLVGELKSEDLALVTVNMDRTPAQGMQFLQRYGIDIPVYLMSRNDLATLGVESLPTSVLIDRQGRPVQIYEGYSPTVPEEIRRLVVGMEGGPSPSAASSGK
jgi:thiol-disulfide isomerase/thioredoxin